MSVGEELEKYMEYDTHFARAITDVAMYLIHNPEKLEEFKDMSFYDKVKDIDWENAVHAHYDMENKCLVVEFPRIGTINKS